MTGFSQSFKAPRLGARAAHQPARTALGLQANHCKAPQSVPSSYFHEKHPDMTVKYDDLTPRAFENAVSRFINDEHLSHNDKLAIADYALAELRRRDAPPYVPSEGWKLVPERFTEAMLEAWFKTENGAEDGTTEQFQPRYKAMLDAAPSPQCPVHQPKLYGAGEPARHTYCPDENDRCQHGDDLNCPALEAK